MEGLFNQRWFVTQLTGFRGRTVLTAVPLEFGCDRELHEVATRAIWPDLVDSDTDEVATRAILPDLVDSDTDEVATLAILPDLVDSDTDAGVSDDGVQR